MPIGGANGQDPDGEREDEHPSSPPIVQRSSHEVVFGAHCDPSPERSHWKKARNHELCPGWWPLHDRHQPDAGFCCSCPCHVEFDRWPGWRRHIDSREGNE